LATLAELTRQLEHGPAVDPRYQRLADHASAHHGLFRTTELDGLGVSPKQVATLVANGWCAPVIRGVYRVRAAPRTAEQRLLAMVWFHPGVVVASHGAAARLHGLPGFDRAPPEITIRRGRSRRGGAVGVHSSLLLPLRHRTVIGVIPCTVIERTLFDLAATLPERRVATLVDWAVSRRLCTLDEVSRAFFVLASRGRAGTASMRAILDARGEDAIAPASELERRARRLFAEGGIPTPEFEVDLGDEAWVGRVDCVWREARLVVELDGRRFHGGATARDADRHRDNRLMAAGWRVLRCTWEDITQRRAWVLDTLRRALGLAA
jgi:hypothetical protein